MGDLVLEALERLEEVACALDDGESFSLALAARGAYEAANPGPAMLTLTPCTLRQANAFIRRHHRTHRPARGAKCVFAAAMEGRVVGVAIVARPRARRLQQDGITAEVVRCCTDGTFDAASFLYARSWVAARALGYRRLVTYTLPQEGGPCLRALRQQGWRRLENEDGQPMLFGGGFWDREARPRADVHPTDAKWRWEVALPPLAADAPAGLSEKKP